MIQLAVSDIPAEGYLNYKEHKNVNVDAEI